MIAAARNSLLSVIFPEECAVCTGQVDDSHGIPACTGCWAETKLFDGSEMLCSKCGAFFGVGAADRLIQCPFCREHFYDKAVACGIYEKALAASVIALKTTPHISLRLRQIIETAMSRLDMSSFELVIPIPLSAARRLERGFNQAELIGSVVGNFAKVPVDLISLIRTRHTPIHRVGMDKRARALSVENVFHVARPKLIQGRRILLVDDVFTSGSTASFCAKMLKKHGAARVEVFTLARAVMD